MTLYVRHIIFIYDILRCISRTICFLWVLPYFVIEVLIYLDIITSNVEHELFLDINYTIAIYI